MFKLRVKLALLSILFLIIALLSKLSIFASNPFISSYLADFLAVIILIFAVKFVLPKLSNYIITVIILIFAFSIEFFQLINSNINLIKIDNFFLQATLGSKFDVLDLVVYVAAGVAGFYSLKLLK